MRFDIDLELHAPSDGGEDVRLAGCLVPGYEPHVEALVTHDVREVWLHLVPVSRITPRNVRVEVVIHGDGGSLEALAGSLDYGGLVAGAVPRVVSTITVADHHLLAACQLGELPARATHRRNTYHHVIHVINITGYISALAITTIYTFHCKKFKMTAATVKLRQE